MAAWFKSMQFSPHWDYDNIVTWSYWTAMGHLPFRDFWYTYGGLFLFDLNWPIGPLLAWVATAGRYAVFASALALGSGKRTLAALVATGALIAAESSGINFAASRYLVAINIVLAFVAANRGQFRERMSLATFVAAVGMALIFEPVQAIYAIPAIVAISAIDALVQRGIGDLRRKAVFCAIVFVAIGAPLAALLGWNGMLAGFIDVHTHLGDVVQYSALPATIDQQWWPSFPIGNVVAWAPAAFLLIGLVEYRRADPQARLRAGALVGIAIVNFMVLQKHLIRPMPDTLILYVFVAGLAFGVLAPVSRPSRFKLGLGVAAGLLVAGVMVLGTLGSTWTSIVGVPARFAGSVSALVSTSVSAQANRDRFAPERFTLYKQQLALAAELERRQQRKVRLFALTDDPILYVLSGQGPVWQANLYNGAPLHEQRRVIEMLRQQPPDYVIGLPSRAIFDEVPVAVRVPEIVAFVIEHYVVDAPFDTYVVLRPRRDGEPIQPATWKALFGDSLNLGMVPYLLGRENSLPCSPQVSCEDALVLTPAGAVTDPATSVRLVAGDLSVELQVRLKRAGQRYVLPIGRLWPSVAARAAGLEVQITAPDGFAMERTKIGRPQDRLY